MAEISRIYQDNAFVPCLMGADLNIIKKSDEKNKPDGYNHQSFILNTIIEQVGLRELPLNGRKFTWANNLQDPTYEKLDRILICPDWEDHYPLDSCICIRKRII